MADEHALAWAEPVAIATLIESLGEQGRGEEADAVLAARELTEWQQGTARAALYLHARGAAAARAGPPRRGARRLPPRRARSCSATGSTTRRCRAGAPAPRRRCCERASATRPAPSPRRSSSWRRPFAARHAIGARAADPGARRRHRSTALREATDDARRLALAPAPRPRPRRPRGRAEARRASGPRRASRCARGSTSPTAAARSTLAEHAEQELATSGARPRRRAVSGIEALTPSQLRIAKLAADGPLEPRHRPGAVPEHPHRREPAAPDLR